MKNILKKLLVTAFVLGAIGSVYAADNCKSDCDPCKTECNKTYMNARSHGTNLALWYGPGVYEIITRNDKDKFGGYFQAVAWYQKGDMDGKYWSPKCCNPFCLDEEWADLNKIYGKVCNPAANDEDIRQLFPFTFDKLKTNNNNCDDKCSTTCPKCINFDPEQTAYGVTLMYDQRLDSILKGLYFTVQLPIVHVENDLGMTINYSSKDLNTAMKNYLAGKEVKVKAPNTLLVPAAQVATVDCVPFEKLCYATICGDDSETGIADIDIVLGYTFLNKNDYHASLNLGLTIPTGNDADGKKLHEAIVGNGGHFGFGGGMTFDARIWGDIEHNFMLYLALKYRYLFESSECRTLGLCDVPWGHYTALLKLTKAEVDAQPPVVSAENKIAFNNIKNKLVPAANILTRNVDVTPGSEFEGVVALAYNNGGFGANLGYNLYYREAEDIDKKCVKECAKACGCCTDSSSDATYYLITKVEQKGANAAAAIDPEAGGGQNLLSGANSTVTVKKLEESMITKKVAETPSQTTHKIFGGLAWSLHEWETPVNIGIGAHYEFASKTEAYEGWGINGRLGIGF